MRQHEICSCGAEIKIRARRHDALRQVEIWRLDHPHQERNDEAPEQRGTSAAQTEIGFQQREDTVMARG